MAQLGDLLDREPIQGAGPGRLLGKALAAPRLGQGQVRPQPGVHWSNGPASRQNADEDIEQFARRRMDYRLEWQPYALEHGFQKVGPRQTVTQYAQRGKVSLIGPAIPNVLYRLWRGRWRPRHRACASATAPWRGHCARRLEQSAVFQWSVLGVSGLPKGWRVRPGWGGAGGLRGKLQQPNLAAALGDLRQGSATEFALSEKGHHLLPQVAQGHLAFEPGLEGATEDH